MLYYFVLCYNRWKNSPPPHSGVHYAPTKLEKVANCVTHLPWVPVSGYYAASLVSKTTNFTEFLVALVYGLSLIFMFAASSAFHCCTLLPSKRQKPIKTSKFIRERVMSLYFSRTTEWNLWLGLVILSSSLFCFVEYTIYAWDSKVVEVFVQARDKLPLDSPEALIFRLITQLNNFPFCLSRQCNIAEDAIKWCVMSRESLAMRCSWIAEIFYSFHFAK